MADQPGTQNYGKSANLTSDQNTRAAQSRANQAAQHEYSCEIMMRGDCRMNPTLSTTISGTQSKFDRTYQTMSVVHRITASGGYTMEITGQTDDGGGGGTPTSESTPIIPDAPNDAFGFTDDQSAPSLGQIGGDNPYDPANVGPNPAGITP